MSLAGCCTVAVPSAPSVPCGPAADETSAAAELMSRCQQMHEERGVCEVPLLPLARSLSLSLSLSLFI